MAGGVQVLDPGSARRSCVVTTTAASQPLSTSARDKKSNVNKLVTQQNKCCEKTSWAIRK